VCGSSANIIFCELTFQCTFPALTRRSAKTGKVIPHQLPMAKWPVKIELHHPAYLSWEEYVKNGERLRQNWSREAAA
jgi:hypothetical protein